MVGSFFKLSSSHIVLTTSPLVSSVFTGLGNSARAACHGLASERMLEVSFSVKTVPVFLLISVFYKSADLSQPLLPLCV